MRRSEDHKPADEGKAHLPRLFVREPGWRVGLKLSSEREFCFNVHPGEDAHHRIAQGELFLHSPDEKLCVPCAERRGLLHFEPRPLRKPVAAAPLNATGWSDPGEDQTFAVLDRFGVNAKEDHEPPSIRQ